MQSTGSRPASAVLVLLAAAAPATTLADTAATQPATRPAATSAATVAVVPCDAAGPVQPDLRTGLELYVRGEWQEAARALKKWAAHEDATKDPAAGRGFYALAFADRMSGRPQAAEGWLARGRPLLEARVASSPSLEDWYYLASLHRMAGDSRAQLGVVADFLRAASEERVCPDADGDDLFRMARLQGFAGRDEARAAALEAAAEKYEKGDGSILAYRALATKELGEAALSAGDDEAAARHLAVAAELDPSQPGVHRKLGLALLRLDRPGAAAAHWRQSWRKERDGGNDLLYAVRVLMDVTRYRERFGDEHALEDLDEYTVPALEQNARHEATEYQAKAAAATALEAEGGEGEELEALRLARDIADYRMNQLLAEYVERDEDLAEFALQNGLLGAIHHRQLPR